MHRVSIEPATANDYRECARLLVQQLAEHGIDASAESLAPVLEEAVADIARGFLVLARDDGRVVGVAYVATILSVEHCGLVAWLEELYVTPECRHRGIVSALMTAVLKRLQETGSVAIDLEVDVGHSRAISLYQRFGFRRLDRSRWVKELKN